jgi:hypothetical protein
MAELTKVPFGPNKKPESTIGIRKRILSKACLVRPRSDNNLPSPTGYPRVSE